MLFILGNLTSNDDDNRNAVFSLSNNCGVFFTLLDEFVEVDRAAVGTSASCKTGRPDSPDNENGVRDSSDLIVKVPLSFNHVRDRRERERE